IFFFSSRRRHTRCLSDWSSDVCSSDLLNMERKSDQEPIPNEYTEFRELFREKPPAEALPEHRPWDHEIPLQEGKHPTYGPIYQMTEKELETVRRYLKTHLEKGYIQPSTS